MKPIPETANRADWPRLVAAKVNTIGNAVDELRAATDWSALGNYANDPAAAAGGVAVGELYRTGTVIKVRIT